ncbi:polar-differentiation response regulator DivK [bacterium BMS3Abin01]|nr:polar-differentiation response regulator DivK [bacterium BMS3Abin01]HDY69563.1 response regulator [Actinomycetota bacterium]
MAKVLLVEDNHMNSRLTEFVLERDGFTVATSPNAEEAIEAARRDKPDLILMDIQLPGMDGLKATRILKQDERTADVPIVAITAHAMGGDEERIMAAGCEGYISKPINTWQLAETVKKYIGG